MTKIGSTVVENGIDKINKLKQRTTVRGVRLKEDSVYMLYSKAFDDYTFPGGGVKSYEKKEQALHRELLEEVGALNPIVTKEIGYTIEFRYGINGSGSIYKQTSYYYLYEATEFCEPQYVGRELQQGLKGVWVKIDDVINHNEKIINNERKDSKGFQTVLIRENNVLKFIKEKLL